MSLCVRHRGGIDVMARYAGECGDYFRRGGMVEVAQRADGMDHGGHIAREGRGWLGFCGRNEDDTFPLDALGLIVIRESAASA